MTEGKQADRSPQNQSRKSFWDRNGEKDSPSWTRTNNLTVNSPYKKEQQVAQGSFNVTPEAEPRTEKQRASSSLVKASLDYAVQCKRLEAYRFLCEQKIIRTPGIYYFFTSNQTGVLSFGLSR